jgi:DNA repair exonuclease SbcCD ATPase subunit
VRANLKIKDIGGLRGEFIFPLESGKLNVVEASNSGGKTSVIRALVSVLSIPQDGELDPNMLNEAQKLGIKADEKNPQEGFVNVHAESGEVQLEIEGNIVTYKVKQNGQPVQLPNGDPRFLLAGVLSNDTKILRQLHGVEENEPDDFKWAVTQLSYAQNYDTIHDLLKNRKEDLSEKKVQIDKILEKLSELQSQKIELQAKLSQLDLELAKLEPRFKGLKEPLRKRKELSKYIDELTIKIGEKNGEIDRKKKGYDAQIKIVSDITKKLEKIDEEINGLDIATLRKQKEMRVPQIEEEVNYLKNLRAEVDALLNLFVTAQTSLRKEEKEAKCPLCNDGHITYNYISKKLEELRDKRNEISAKISELNQERVKLDQELDNLTKREEELKKQRSNTEQELLNAKKALKGIERDMEALKVDVQRNETRLKEAMDKLNELISVISKSDEEVNKLYTEKEKERYETSVKLGVIAKQLEQSSVPMGELIVDPVSAKKICDAWIQVIDDLILYVSKKAEEQRQKAAKRFNDNIQELMNTLGFKEFRNVRLNKDYRLYIERLNPKTNDYVAQPVQTLSTSEKLAIALILQAALKETYIPDIPFFILDDIMEDFDDERKKRITDYLLQKANQEGWFIVVTKLVEDAGRAKIKYVGG